MTGIITPVCPLQTTLSYRISLSHLGSCPQRLFPCRRHPQSPSGPVLPIPWTCPTPEPGRCSQAHADPEYSDLVVYVKKWLRKREQCHSRVHQGSGKSLQGDTEAARFSDPIPYQVCKHIIWKIKSSPNQSVLVNIKGFI